MLFDGGKGAAQIVMRNALSFGDFPDDVSQCRVVGMRHIREEVMLDLVVQATGEPGRQTRASRKIRCRPHLVRGPVVPFDNSVEFHVPRQMRNLEHQRKQPAEDRMEEHECGD